MIWQIAAINSFNDIFALNVVCFPAKHLELDVLKSILAGSFLRVCRAGAFLADRHSVHDYEPKYGLEVYGEVKKSELWMTTGAKAGNPLIMTKLLCIGIAITAIKAEMIDNQSTLREAQENMKMLNDISLPAELHSPLQAAYQKFIDCAGEFVICICSMTRILSEVCCL